MEKIIDEHNESYSQLFAMVGKGNYLHVNLKAYSKAALNTECTRQNKYAGCNSLDNKYVTTTQKRKGYLTIYQRK
jgi:hypothetical protein